MSHFTSENFSSWQIKFVVAKSVYVGICLWLFMWTCAKFCWVWLDALFFTLSTCKKAV